MLSLVLNFLQTLPFKVLINLSATTDLPLLCVEYLKISLSSSHFCIGYYNILFLGQSIIYLGYDQIPLLFQQALHKILKFHLIFWCVNFVKTYSFCRNSRMENRRKIQNFLTRKLAEVTVFYAMKTMKSCCSFLIFQRFNSSKFGENISHT